MRADPLDFMSHVRDVREHAFLEGDHETFSRWDAFLQSLESQRDEAQEGTRVDVPSLRFVRQVIADHHDLLAEALVHVGCKDLKRVRVALLDLEEAIHEIVERDFRGIETPGGS